jgi:hypothetical protein
MDTTNLVPVNIGACSCPERPHAEGDVVYLRPRLDLRGGFRVRRRLFDLNKAAYDSGGAPNMDDLEISLAEVYLDEGVAGWNLVDEDGNDRELTPEAMEEFIKSDYGRAEAAADAADDLYRPAVFDPLAQRALSSLPPTSTNGSTSATNGHGSKKKKPTGRSSTTSTQTASTVETS